MASVIDTHPKRNQILDAILSGKSLRTVGRMAGVSHTVIQDYKRKVVGPAIRHASKVIEKKGIPDARPNPTREASQDYIAESREVTKEIIASNPILDRLERKFVRLDVAIAESMETKDFGTMAKLEAVDCKAIELLGKATLAPGFTAEPQHVTNHYAIALLPTPGQLSAPAECIDVEVIESNPDNT